MPYGAHETMEVHEMLNEKINMINHFSLYAEQCRNPQLRQMIERHLQTAVQSYDQLIAYTHDYNAVSNRMQMYGAPDVHPQHIEYGLRNPAPVGPQMHGQLNDQQIVSAMLACHKNSAKNQMQAALECADPNVRNMLTSGALNCANQAYEVFLFMNQHGQYQVPTMNDHTAKTYLHSYQPVNGMSRMPMGGTMSGMAPMNEWSRAGEMHPMGGPMGYTGGMHEMGGHGHMGYMGSYPSHQTSGFPGNHMGHHTGGMNDVHHLNTPAGQHTGGVMSGIDAMNEDHARNHMGSASARAGEPSMRSSLSGDSSGSGSHVMPVHHQTSSLKQ